MNKRPDASTSTIRVAAMVRFGVLGLAVSSIGALAQCPANDQPPSLTCTDFSAYVPPGTCLLIANPCSGQHWLTTRDANVDGFGIEPRPASVFVRTDPGPDVTTWSLCAASTSPNINTESLVFTYERSTIPFGSVYGTGHLTLTVSPALVLAASATPELINLGDSSQLMATVSGGIAPYSYSWVPTSGIDEERTATPRASPSFTTIYSVRVVDAAGQSKRAQVTVTVRRTLAVTANPPVIDSGDTSQLNASGGGGTLPYTFLWVPAEGLNNPTIANPAAFPATTTTYTATVTDANGTTLTGSAEVVVNVLITNMTATPATINAGASSQLDVTHEGGNGVYTYAWSPATGLSDPTIRNPVASPSSTTSYSVTVSDGRGLATTVGGLVVTVNAAPPPPPPALTASFRISRDGANLFLDAGRSTGEIVSYAWEFSWTAASPDFTTTSPAIATTFVEGDSGTITLTVSGADGSTATVSRPFP